MADASSIDALRAHFHARLAAAATDARPEGARRRVPEPQVGLGHRAAEDARSLPPEARREFGALVNALKTEIETRARRAPRGARGQPAAGRQRRRHAARARAAARPRPPADARAPAGRGHLHPHGLRDPRRAGSRRRLPQLRSAQHAAGSSRARHAGHAVPRRADRRRHLGRAPARSGGRCPTRRSAPRRCCARTRRRCRSAT